MAGKLYVCGTPIGNLEDISLRCIKTLREVDVIAAEDTRNTIKLLNHYDIKTPLTSYHKFNEEEKGAQLAERLKGGESIALVSDAGMPGISDPGETLIKLCRQEGIEVTTVPGPTALISALVLSGLGGRSFVFEGFLPTNKKMRREVLSKLKTETRTTVFYEAPHHLKATLKEIYEAVGEREVCAVRELTKIHEETLTMPLSEMISYYEEREPKGEFVVIIGGISPEVLECGDKTALEPKELYDFFTSQGFDRKEAMKLCAKELGVSKKEIYKRLLEN